MAEPSKPTRSSRPSEPSGPAPEPASGIVVLLCSTDKALQRAWSKTAAPPGFHLASATELKTEHLADRQAHLVLVDAATAIDTVGPLRETLRQEASRCVWTGPADVLDRLEPDWMSEAYDLLVTPATPAVLAQRLATWARHFRKTETIEELGRRCESLVEENDRLGARLAEAETRGQVAARHRERFDQVRRRLRQVAALAREINSLDLDRIVRVCVERLPELIEAEKASLYLYDASENHLILQGHTHPHEIAKHVSLKDNPRSPMAVAVQRGEVLLIGDFLEFERQADVALEREYQDRYATRSCILVPLKGGGRVRGILNLADKRGEGRFDEELDLPIVEQIAELIGASIYNVELYQEMERRAKTDPLTGLANRRAMEDALARETDRSRRYGAKMTVLMIDVDHLKIVNDRFGHEAGDAVLRNLAAVIAEAVRSVDAPGRWTGGDEFLVVLPDTSSAQAYRLAERLLERLSAKPVQRGDDVVPSSLSIGVAEYRKDESVEGLIHRVDMAMYQAKQAGRNRIIIDGEAPPAAP